MEIYYKKDTLYVDIDELINNQFMTGLKSKVFSILNNYDIDNIVLNIINDNHKNQLFDSFISEYEENFQGRIIIK